MILCIFAKIPVYYAADKLNTLLKAADCKFVESYLTNLFANALSGRNIKDLLSAQSTVGVASAPAAAAPAAQPAAAAAAPAKAAEVKEEEKKKEESEESDGDLGFDLFG